MKIVVVLVLLVRISKSEDVFESVRRSLGLGEKALQKSEWFEASTHYEKALGLVRSHGLIINVAAESQLYNNVGWAAYQLGEYEKALSRYETGARACDRALSEGLSECVTKVYENIYDLVHKVLNRRAEAIAWMRQGASAAQRAASSRGLVGAEAIDLGAIARLRLGYLLVLHNELQEAEEVLFPLLRAYLSEEIIFPPSDWRRRTLAQEAAGYLGWSKSLRRDWPAASNAFALAAQLALPTNGTQCTRGYWLLRQGWLLPQDDWFVEPLLIPWQSLTWTQPPWWCISRKRVYPEDTCTADFDPSDNWKAQSHGPPARIKLIHAQDVWLGGEAGAVAWQPPPRCNVLTGDRTAAGSLPADWGLASVNAGLPPPPDDWFSKNESSASSSSSSRVNLEDSLFLGDPVRGLKRKPAHATTSRKLRPIVESVDAAIVLLDSRESHKMFWHHQTETVSRLALCLSHLFDRDGLPTPKTIDKNAILLFPITLGPTIQTFLKIGHAVALQLNATNRLRPYEWRPTLTWRLRKAYFLDWTAPNDFNDMPLRWQTRHHQDLGQESDQNTQWLSNYVARVVPQRREYIDSIFRLHYVPQALLRLQAQLLRRAFSDLYLSSNSLKPDTLKTRIHSKYNGTLVLIYSRADTDKRHVVSEAKLVDLLKAHWRDRNNIEIMLWRGGVAPDIERAAKDWGRAALVIAPHGAGIANIIHCAPGTPLLVLPSTDAVAAPSASDEYFIHAARALDLRLHFAHIDQPPPMFFNFSFFHTQQLQSLVLQADSLLFPPPCSSNTILSTPID